MEQLTSFVVSIFANVATNIGQSILKKILKNNDVFTQIEEAYNNSLDKWSENSQIKKREKIYLSTRFEQLVDCINDEKNIENLDPQISSLLKLFQQELYKKQIAWNFIQDIQFQNKFSKITLIERHLKALKSDIHNLIIDEVPVNKDFLLPYQEAFKKQLLDSNQNLPLYFSNPFIGRESYFDDLDYSVRISPDKVIAVVADGGYGKTRLCIEYFKKLKELDENFEVLVLTVNDISSIDLNAKLQQDRQYIIFVDDAHKRSKILNELVIFANRKSNVKILLTIRKATYSDTINEFSSHNKKIEPIKLERLSYEDSQKIIKSLIALPEIEIKRLASKSKGVPIVVLAICESLVTKGKTTLDDDESFTSFVREVKKQIIEDIYSKNFIDKEKVNKTLELLSVLSPLNNSKFEINLFAEFNSMTYEDTDLIINHLVESNFVTKTYGEISIKPDPYSDILFLDASYRLNHLLKKKGIHTFTDRIIRNMIELEKSEELKFNPEKIINDFIESFSDKKIEERENRFLINNNIKTLRYFAYKKPEICVKAISNLVRVNQGDTNFWSTSLNNTFHESITDVLAITALNTLSPNTLEEIYSIVCLYEKNQIKNKVFKKVFRFRIYDFKEYSFNPPNSLLRQRFLLEKIAIRIKTKVSTQSDLDSLLLLFQVLLNLEYDGESFMDQYTATFHFSRAYVPFNNSTKELRLETLNLLFNTHQKFKSTLNTFQLFDMLVNVLFYSIKRRKDLNKYDQTEEVNFVLKVFTELLKNEDSIIERGCILKVLRMFDRREYKEEYKERLTLLLESVLNVKNLKSELELLVVEDLYYLTKNVEERMNSIVSKYSDWNRLINDLINIRENLDSSFREHFFEILEVLNKKYPDKAKDLLDKVISSKPHLIGDFASLIRANYKDEKYFYLTIEKIKKIENKETRHVIPWMLVNGRARDYEVYNTKDLKYFQPYVNEEDINIFSSVRFGFPLYIHIAPSQTLKILSEIIRISDTNQLSHDLLFFVFNNDELLEKFPTQIKDFLFQSTLNFRIDENFMSRALIFLETYFDFDTLIEYLKLNIHHQRSNQYFAVFSSTSEYKNPKKLIKDSELDFIDTLQRFIHSEKKLTLGTLNFIKPSKACSPNLIIELEKIAKRYYQDKEMTIRLCEGLSVFEIKNEDLILFLIKVTNKLIDGFGSLNNEELLRIFSRQFRYNSGLKSGTSGQPFPADLRKQKLIKEVIEKGSAKSEVESFLSEVLKTVESSMEDDRNYGQGEKW